MILVSSTSCSEPLLNIVAGSETATWLIESGEARRGERRWRMMRSEPSADIQPPNDQKPEEFDLLAYII